jgi:hypothetical protein
MITSWFVLLSLCVFAWAAFVMFVVLIVHHA